MWITRHQCLSAAACTSRKPAIFMTTRYRGVPATSLSNPAFTSLKSMNSHCGKHLCLAENSSIAFMTDGEPILEPRMPFSQSTMEKGSNCGVRTGGGPWVGVLGAEGGLHDSAAPRARRSGSACAHGDGRGHRGQADEAEVLERLEQLQVRVQRERACVVQTDAGAQGKHLYTRPDSLEFHSGIALARQQRNGPLCGRAHQTRTR